MQYSSLLSLKLDLGQGGELIHTEFNRTGRVVHGMKDPIQRLMAIMRRHHVGTTPEVQAEVAPVWRKNEK
jgi:hypothetical protein